MLDRYSSRHPRKKRTVAIFNQERLVTGRRL
jgi:hypothetical protein